MSLEIIADKVYESRISQDKTGYHHTRLFTVTGLSGKLTTPAEALAACPQYGTPHPFLPNCIATNVQVDPLNRGARTACKVTVTYGPPEMLGGSGASITISGSNGQRKISFDPKTSLPLLVNYTGKDANGNSTTWPDYVDVTVLSPGMILTYEAIITFTAGNGPIFWNKTYRRTVNANPWQQGEKWTWLCRDISAKSLGGGTSWSIAASFEYSGDNGWLKVESFRDVLHGGQIPSDIDPADLANPYILGGANNAVNQGQTNKNGHGGCTAILPYSPIDFSPLGIPDIP